LREKTLIGVLVMLLIALPLAYKHGRVVMYAQICETLGVTEDISIQVGTNIITHKGIWTPPKPQKPTDLCNACHTGGV
jgi:hypothetical protein